MISLTLRTGALIAFPYTKRQTCQAIQVMLECLGTPAASLELILTGDEEIARLNEEFLGCIGPTNILSFPSEEQESFATGSTGGATLDSAAQKSNEHHIETQGKMLETMPPYDMGVLALSTVAVVRESFLYGQRAEEHALRLIAHGLLHLAGYEHGFEMDMQTDSLVEHSLRFLS
ncbi:rRNA maturation RNase YbeY [Oleidesulfovibrio sp.]|uniref:rRNA maturation RNase YbeY n=1 Tax=Oleidesulfovibrio sp. TaxID=2909707 RepID=UPI003A8423C4